MELSTTEFEMFQSLIYRLCGLVISDQKAYLVQQRLDPILQSGGYRDFIQLYRDLQQDGNDHLRSEVIAALTTNETSFFRDQHPYDAFRDNILPDLYELAVQRKQRPDPRRGAKINIWSAAASTGQEAYSLAMLIDRYTRSRPDRIVDTNDFSLLATDISVAVLAQAITGSYTELEVSRGLPPEFRDKYFHKSGTRWILDESLRSLVQFRQLNLNESFTHLKGFDVIFCRNVLIYFDDEAKRKILKQFYELLTQDGFLVLGSSENIYMLSDEFASIRFGESVVYKKIPASAVAVTSTPIESATVRTKVS